MSEKESERDPVIPPSPSFSRRISRHFSTPQLETFRVTRSASSVTPKHNYMSPQPMTSFTTFTQTKSKVDLARVIQDDPNPYSVSQIDEFRIQVQDPYRIRIKSTNHLNNSSAVSDRSSSTHYYQDLDDYDTEHDLRNDIDLPEKLTTLPTFYTNRGSSVGYESIDTEGLSGGSSEDLPPPPSESSEEYMHSLSITTSTGSGGMSPLPVDFVEPEVVTPAPSTTVPVKDLARIELALKGRKTQIFISDSLANLYYYKAKTSVRSSSATPSISSATIETDIEDDWVLKHTGIPVLLLDTGETKSRDKRKIQIVLADLGSGLALWKDTIDHLTNYGVGSGDVSTFHTMHLSFDHTKIVGLSFDNDQSAIKFFKEVEKLTSDFANISLSGSKHKNKNKKESKSGDKKKKGDKWVRPSKSDISQPCAFQHVSTLSSKDKGIFSSLQHFMTGKGSVTPSSTSLGQ